MASKSSMPEPGLKTGTIQCPIHILPSVCSTANFNGSSWNSRYSRIPISRTLGFANLPIFRANSCFLGFTSLKLYNFTPGFSNPRILETLDNSNQFWLPWGKLTLDNSNLQKFPNHLVWMSIKFTPLNKLGTSSTRSVSQIIDQSFLVAKRQQLITNYFS